MAAIAEILQALYDSGKLAAASRRITSQADYEKVMNATEHNIKPKMPEQAILNTCSGWADASGSMHALHKRVKALGVTFAAGIVARLIEQDGDIKGAEMQDGRMFTAKRITILAAGSWSGTILPELRSILKATGQSLATFQLTPEEVERYRDCVSSVICRCRLRAFTAFHRMPTACSRSHHTQLAIRICSHHSLPMLKRSLLHAPSTMAAH